MKHIKSSEFGSFQPMGSEFGSFQPMGWELITKGSVFHIDKMIHNSEFTEDYYMMFMENDIGDYVLGKDEEWHNMTTISNYKPCHFATFDDAYRAFYNRMSLSLGVMDGVFLEKP